ncbi:hypothetical protein ACQPYK_28890 [Streptosporangium sp. CA-135522]|uniref:hypothetical protein n=1 Tax=Streptosporangium sp. CA-135522 TaxID=3240072 RepID=UPI003D9471D0
MQTEWDPDELIDAWTLVDSDWELVGNKSGTTRLGFVILSPQGSVYDVYDLR